MDHSFSFITSLQYQLKAALAQLAAFQSGKKYQDMQEMHRKEVLSLKQKERQTQEELTRTRRDMVRARNHWFEVFEDLEKECRNQVEKLEKQLRAVLERALRAERQRDEALDKLTHQRQKIYELETELEKEKGKNLRLQSQLNHDHENSSLPSSRTLQRKKITNNREKTGRKPGGQPGHKGHIRKKQEPTAPVIVLPPPQKVLDDPEFKKTSRRLKKQMVNIRLVLEVTEYQADVYYNAKTGERVHAEFPPGLVNEVNYGGSIKAFLFLLNNDCCTSIDKSCRFLLDLTGGKLQISKGMVSRLVREFADRTRQERNETFLELLRSPVLHTDCTNAGAGGKSAYVFVCAAPEGKALYFARSKKGHKGAEGTVVQDYEGILVQDHERTFYQYGRDHQECLAHVLRYLKDSIENEPERSWNKQMQAHIRKMIHYRNSLDAGEACAPEEIACLEKEYREILEKAKEEYEYIPATEYYKKGYNLYLRLEKYMHNHFLFLYDPQVPSTNNEAERLLRSYKRKQQQAVSFRNIESIRYLCESMGMLIKIRQKYDNLFEKVSQIFE